jgi:hypothetical protein
MEKNMSTYIPPKPPERPILLIEYDREPGDRPDNTRTVYYLDKNLQNGQLVTIQQQRFVNYHWIAVSEKQETLSYEEITNKKGGKPC